MPPDGMAGPWSAYAAPSSTPGAMPPPAPLDGSQGVSVQPVAPAAGPWAAYAAPAAQSVAAASPSGIDATGYPLVPDAPSSPPQPGTAQPTSFLGRVGHAIDSGVRSVEQGATFGFGDEINAAENAVEQPLFDAGSNAPSLLQRYNENLVAERARNDSIPAYVSVPGQIVGGIATMAGEAPAVLARGIGTGVRAIPGGNALLGALGSAGEAVAQPVANLLAQVPGSSVLGAGAKAATGGAIYGGVQGFGDGQGGFQNRLAGLTTGGETGAVLGPAVELGANLLGKGVVVAKNALSEAGYGAKAPLLGADGQPIIGSNNQTVVATPGVTRVASQQIAAATHDIPAAQAALAQSAELVPGSQPTTFQQTGDAGLGQKELELRNTPGVSTAFINRADQQNAARVDAIEQTVPANASSADFVNSLDAKGNALQANRDQAVEQLHQQADQGVQQAQQSAAAATDALGSAPGGDTGTAGQQLGQAFRAALAGGDQAAKANVTKLANAIDPNGTLAVDQTPVRARANDIISSMSPNAEPIAGTEAGIMQTAQNLPDVQSFRDSSALLSRLTTALRTERSKPDSDPQIIARLSSLLDAVHGSMADSVSRPHVTLPGVGGAADAGGSATPAASPVLTSAAASVSPPGVGSDVFTPSGQRVGVNYELANAPDLIVSHNSDMTPNPEFPPELQPRARDRAASEVQVANIASRLQPERLGASSTVADGAPIVGPDGIVESGNGRVLALRRAYDANGPQAASYRDWLGSQGHDTAGMTQPVLIRRRTTPMTDEQRVAFAGEGSTPTTLAMSATERAAADAKRLTSDVLGQVQPGDVTDPANRDFARSYMRNVVEPGQEGSFAAADGSLSQEGAARMRAALVHKAYGDNGLSAALAESTDPTAKVLAGAMQDAAGPMARLKSGIDAGHVDPAVDLGPPLVEAAQMVQQARARGISLADHVGQQDAFNRLSPEADTLLRAAYGPSLAGRMSSEQFGGLLNDYAKRAGEQSTAGNLFGPNLTRDEILQGSVTRYGKSASLANGQAAPVDAISAGAVDGALGNRGGRSVSGAGGQGASDGGGGQGGQATARVLPQPAPALTANFDQAAADRYGAMRAAHAERKDTFGPRAPGVGAILAPGPTSGSYRMPDSAVPSAIFAKGPGGAERVQAALKAGLTTQQIGDAAAYSLRTAAADADGVIKPQAATRWRQQHADAFEALRQADPKIAARFDSAQQMGAQLFRLQAQRAALEKMNPNRPGVTPLGDAAQHVQALRDFQASAARHFLPGENTADQVGSRLGGKTAVADMRSLAQLTQNDPDARAGLQRAIVDHMFSRLQGNAIAGQTGTEKLKSDAFQTFMARAAPALREVMTKAQVDGLQAVAADLQRANMSIDGVRAAGGSDTAQKAALLATGSLGQNVLSLAKSHGLTGMMTLIGSKAGPLGAYLGNSAGKALGTLKAAGIAQTSDLVKEAMLNPALARVLLSNVTEKTAPNVRNALAATLGRMAAARGAHAVVALKQN